MKTYSLTRIWILLAATFVLLSIAGCKTYKVDVTLRPDGGGSRTVLLKVETDQNNQGYLAADGVQRLFRLSEEAGWRTERNEEGTVTGFRREVRIDNQQDWQAQSGDISIRSSLDENVPLDQGMVNSIAVESGQETGGRSYVYRESFVWTGIKETIIGFIAEHFRMRMAAQYPILTAGTQAELRGLMTGHLSLAWPHLFENDDSEAFGEMMGELKLSVTAVTEDIVHRAQPQADLTPIGPLVEVIMDDKDSELEQYMNAHLPGFDQAVITNIELQIVMPGEIIETNADQQEGQVASWEFSPADAMKGPLEIFARSVVPR